MSVGADFRTAIAEQLELDQADPMWLGILDQACALLDDIAVLDAAILASGPTVAGSRGQVQVSPLIPERRQARLALAKLLSQLGLSEAESFSDRQRRNAMKGHHARRSA